MLCEDREQLFLVRINSVFFFVNRIELELSGQDNRDSCTIVYNQQDVEHREQCRNVRLRILPDVCCTWPCRVDPMCWGWLEAILPHTHVAYRTLISCSVHNSITPLFGLPASNSHKTSQALLLCRSYRSRACINPFRQEIQNFIV